MLILVWTASRILIFGHHVKSYFLKKARTAPIGFLDPSRLRDLGTGQITW